MFAYLVSAFGSVRCEAADIEGKNDVDNQRRNQSDQVLQARGAERWEIHTQVQTGVQGAGAVCDRLDCAAVAPPVRLRAWRVCAPLCQEHAANIHEPFQLPSWR